MEPILAGLETEYGLYIEGRGPENQVDDSQALVRAYPGKRFVGWDYRFETPRSDLRGFRVDRLSEDPDDAQFDAGRTYGSDQEMRADRVLPNGARLYNDHGHPEYATPECRSLNELVLHDLAGELAVLRAAAAYEQETGRRAKLYKNNTDFHGASYGSHESYLVPRRFGFDDLYLAVTPILIARQVLCGAGKVGAETGPSCAYQLTQRADFLSQAASVETLFRRSLFNTRDEPHADPERWVRLHVICGDANRIPSCTRRKAGLVRLALALMTAGEAPTWEIPHPVEAFQAVSRDESGEYPMALARRSWTTAAEVLESYFAAAERVFGAQLEAKGFLRELGDLIRECRELIVQLREVPEQARKRLDWSAKRWLLDSVRQEAGWDWGERGLRSYDLEYHNVDPQESLYAALAEAGEAEAPPSPMEVEKRLESVFEPTRARARGTAVANFGDRLQTVGWRKIVLKTECGDADMELDPNACYPKELGHETDVERFIEILRSLPT
jgi:Pup amidohydrolase